MEIAPFTSVQLPPGQRAKDVLCACFHPTLPSVYLGFKGSVVEYDVEGGSEVGVFPLRMAPQNLLFLGIRNALVVCMADGSVVVIDTTDGHVLSEHSPIKPADARPFVACALAISRFHLLVYARTKSHTAQCINLFSQNKKPISYPGHKSSISAIAVHPTLPLVGCGATDGTVRIFDIFSTRLYNVIQSEKAKDGVHVFCSLQFHQGGNVLESSPRKAKAAKGRRARGGDGLYSDVRLMLVAEHGLIVYYDISIPGAPNKLRDFFEPGSYFRDAHFNTLKSDFLFCLDHKGRYISLHADPTLPEGASNPLPKRLKSGKKGGAIKFTPNAKAFSLLEECENTAPFQLPVRSGGRHGNASLPKSCASYESRGLTSLGRSLACHMHPSAPYFLFHGSDLGSGEGRSLALFHLRSVAGTRGVALPLHTTLPTPLSYWHTPDLAHSTATGGVYSVTLEGKNTIVVTSHPLDAAGGKGSAVLRFVPKGERGPMGHCTPLAVFASPPSHLAVTVRCNGRGGSGKPHWASLPIASASSGKPDSAPETPDFAEGFCCGRLGGQLLILSASGSGEVAWAGRRAQLPGVTHAICLGGDSVLVTFREPTGKTRLLSLNGWEGFEGLASGKPHGPSTPLDTDESFEEAVACDTLVGIATSRRVMIASLPGPGPDGASRGLHILRTHSLPQGGAGQARAHSLAWAGRCLLFVSGGHICSLTVNGVLEKTASISERSTIAAVLRDRFVLCTSRAESDEVWARSANHFGSVVRGILASPRLPDTRKLLSSISPRYDCRNTSPSVMRLLCRRGLPDLASSLAALSSRAVGANNPFTESASPLSPSGVPCASWLASCRIQIAAGDVAAAVAVFRDAVARLRQACCDAAAAHGGSYVSEASPSTPAFEAMAVSLFQACPTQELSSQVRQVLRNDMALLGGLRREGDAPSLRRLAQSAATENPGVARLAEAAASAAAAEDSSPHPPPQGASGVGVRWDLGTAVLCPTTVHNPLVPSAEARILDTLPSKDIRSYLRNASGVGAGVGSGGVDASGNPASPEHDDKGSDDSDDDDGRLQEIGADFGAAGPDDAGGDDGEDGDDDISKQQEELRRQYLCSYAGEDAEGDPDDDDDDGFGAQKKFKKFEIKKDAVFKQSLANITLNFAPVPSAATTRAQARGGDAAGGSPSAEGQKGDDAASPDQSTSAALPPSYLGTSAQECLRNAYAKLERNRYDDALKRLQAALVYLQSDSTQVAKKVPLVQVAHYVLCCNLLKEIKDLEQGGFSDSEQQLALLGALLMRVPQQKKHLAMWAKKAVKFNVEAGNYGTAAGIIRREELEEDFSDALDTCTQNSEENASSNAAQLEAEDVVFCWATFSLLQPDGATTTCTYCPAVFSEASATEAGVQCTFCSYGVTE